MGQDDDPEEIDTCGAVQQIPTVNDASIAAASPSQQLLFEDRMNAMSRANRTSLKLVQEASWWSQLQCCLVKNGLLLTRRPILLTSMMLSSVASVLLAWAAGRDSAAPQAALTACGTIADDALRYTRQVSYWGNSDVLSTPTATLNESWRNGLPVAVLCLGPMMVAIGAFLLVTNEIQNQKLGVLRQLGLSDSAYWMSWFLPLGLISLVNSLLGAFTAIWIPVHVYQSLSFGGMLASLLFLQLALLPASFWLAAICGTTRRGLAVWLLLGIMVAVWTPLLALSIQDYKQGTTSHSPGLFWSYRNTTKLERNNNNNGFVDYYNNNSFSTTYSGCDQPLISEAQARTPKTPVERLEFTSSDEMFVGCYAEAGYASRIYNAAGPSNGMIAFTLYLNPYFHFFSMWGNILGYTAMSGNEHKFGFKEATKSPEELSLMALPAPPSMEHANTTTNSQLFAQGSTVVTPTYYLSSEYDNDDLKYYDFNGDESYASRKDNCPSPDLEGYNFCSYLDNCQYAAEPAPIYPTNASPSFLDSLGYLVSLTLIYALLAAYVAQVFAQGNGASRKWFVFVQPAYWFPSRFMDTRIHTEVGRNPVPDQADEVTPSASASSASSNNNDHEESGLLDHGPSSAGVQITNLRKKFGSLEAVKGVSLTMQCGEVTALLGTLRYVTTNDGI
jgi:hypothetical protein